jgi:hypothetical protein
MSKFEELWQSAVAELREDSFEPGLQRLGIPARLATLASRGDGVGEVLAPGDASAAVAAEPDLSGLDRASVDAALRALFAAQGRTGAGDGDLLRKVAQAGGRRLLGSELSDSEAREVVTLLRNGDFFGDLVQSTGAVVLAVPALARTLPATLTDAPGFLRRLLEAVFGDLASLVKSQLPNLARDLADGTIDEPPRVLDRTLREFYGEASIGQTLAAVRTLIDRDNRSVRIAILLYARFNGVPIEERHLDRLHDEVLNPDDPNLGPALQDAVDVLVQRHGGSGEMIALLARLGPHT